MAMCALENATWVPAGVPYSCQQNTTLAGVPAGAINTTTIASMFPEFRILTQPTPYLVYTFTPACALIGTVPDSIFSSDIRLTISSGVDNFTNANTLLAIEMQAAGGVATIDFSGVTNGTVGYTVVTDNGTLFYLGNSFGNPPNPAPTGRRLREARGAQQLGSRRQLQQAQPGLCSLAASTCSLIVQQAALQPCTGASSQSYQMCSKFADPASDAHCLASMALASVCRVATLCTATPATALPG